VSVLRDEKGRFTTEEENITKTCPVCANEFTVHPSSSWRKYCSLECKGEAQKGKFLGERAELRGKEHPNYKEKVVKKCENCGKKFKVPPYRKESAKYCSRKCLYEAHEGNPSTLQHPLPSGEDHPNYKHGKFARGGEKYYGTNWKDQKGKALERDNFTCQICGAMENLQIHHKNPIGNFDEPEEANFLDNLITLCTSCHSAIEPRKSN